MCLQGRALSGQVQEPSSSEFRIGKSVTFTDWKMSSMSAGISPTSSLAGKRACEEICSITASQSSSRRVGTSMVVV